MLTHITNGKKIVHRHSVKLIVLISLWWNRIEFGYVEVSRDVCTTSARQLCQLVDIGGSHGVNIKEYILGCDAVLSGRWVRMFERNL